MDLWQRNLIASPSPSGARPCCSCYFRLRHKAGKGFLGTANLLIVAYYYVKQQCCIDCSGDAFYVRRSMRNKKASQSLAGTSTAAEDYLERILELINSKGYARVIDIAAALEISQASVTNMVQRLDAERLLKYEKYRGLILTPAGKKLARRIAKRHKLLTEFLRLLGVDDRVIHHDVEGMEHHISPSTLRAIASVSRQLQRRPALRAQLQAGAV
jgi:Mn-dependent DtxR family transcriptional regulator